MRRYLLLSSLVCLLPLIAIADHHEGEHGDHDIPKEAVAKLIPTVGNTVNGIIVLTQDGDDTHVTGEVWNLTPGEHGFHIHQYGDLRAGDGTSAGGHYNPDGHEHGGPDAEHRHAGDLGNITADSNGKAKVDVVAKGLKVHFVLGRSLVVHAGKDDLKSQPSGDSGPRVAVGVIGYAEVKEEAKVEAPPSPEKSAEKKPAEEKPADGAKKDGAKE